MIFPITDCQCLVIIKAIIKDKVVIIKDKVVIIKAIIKDMVEIIKVVVAITKAIITKEVGVITTKEEVIINKVVGVITTKGEVVREEDTEEIEFKANDGDILFCYCSYFIY